MMTLSRDQEQLPIPNIDVKDLRVKALMAKHPFPTTRKDAENFIRAKGILNLKYKEDVDQIRMGLKSSNVDEDNVKFEQKADLPIYDQAAYNEKYIEMAQEIYTLFIKLEKDKQ